MKKEKKRKSDRTSGTVAEYGMMIALSFLFSYIETLIPIQLGLPGVKFGLANLVNIVSLYLIGFKGTAAISLVRILLVGLTFGNMFSMLYSLAGGALSLFFMIVCKKKKWFTPIGVSIIGGIAHNIGQLAIAAMVVENSAVFYYLPFLMAAGTAAGGCIGILGGITVKRLSKYVKNR